MVCTSTAKTNEHGNVWSIVTKTVTVCSDSSVDCSSVLDDYVRLPLPSRLPNTSAPEPSQINLLNWNGKNYTGKNRFGKLDCQHIPKENLYEAFKCQRCQTKARFYPHRVMEPSCHRYVSKPKVKLNYIQ